MKHLFSIIVLVLTLSLLSAVDFDFSGQFRTRAAIRNNAAEKDGGSIDNRLQLGMDSELSDGLKFHALFEVGNLTWGGSGGGLSTGGVNVETNELYIDYYVNALDANLKVGQQYWADHRSLILDDFFSGVMLTKDDLAGFKAELAMMKISENVEFMKDDQNVFMANLQGESPIPFGFLTLAGYTADSNHGNFTVMPYVTVAAGPASLDITPFLDYQFHPGDNDEMGMGAAIKADGKLADMEAGVDLLFAAKNGLSSLSPWYQNGLYIYGIGANHDGVNLYWGTPYSGNSKSFVSAVGKLRKPINETLTAYGAAGMLTDMGWEVNAGVEMNMFEDIMKLAAFGAYGGGTEGAKPSNYVLGTSVVVNF